MKFTILGIPQPKQSARFKNVKMGDKSFMKSYQPKTVVENERNIAFDIKSQLPEGHIPLDGPLGIKVSFVFPPLSSWPKWKKNQFLNGAVFYKDSKPDLTDNLMKGLCDAMNGIVFVDDSRICKVESQKIFGDVPRTEFEIYKL